MKYLPRAFSLIVGVLCLTAAARADQFELTYTFGAAPGTMDSTFDGTLNGNLITNISDVTLNFGPGLYNSVTAGDTIFVESTGTLIQNGGAVISLDGSENNFFFSDQDYGFPNYSYNEAFLSLSGSAADLYDGGFSFVESLDLPDGVVSYDESLQVGGNPVNSSWSVVDLSTQNVPDAGSTLAMVGGACAALAALRRRFAS